MDSGVGNMDGGGMSARRLRVLGIQDRRLLGFNSPRASRHMVEHRRILRLEKVHRPISGGAMINPWPPRRFDLVHAWNRVPLGPTPFVVGFEWHLPLSWEHTPRSFNMLMDALASPRCRRIVAASQAAATLTTHRHVNDPRLEVLQSKMTVRLPNVVIPKMTDWFDPAAKLEQLRFVFVGDEFATKGGCVAVKLAEKARAAGLPVHITIVSSLGRGNLDPQRAAFVGPYTKLLDQPNITLMPPQPHDKVMELTAGSHLTLLPTLGDWYDFNAMEGMARFTPMIVTALGAFPEIVDPQSGVLLSVDTTCQGEWRQSDHRVDRTTPDYEQVFADTVDRLTEQAFGACADLLNNPAKLGALRQGARRMAEQKLDSVEAARFWDQVYLDAIERG